MDEFSFSELADMHLVYGEARCNAREAARLYSEKFPNRRQPDRRLFQTTDRRIRETGSVKANKSGLSGRPKAVDPATEERILDVFHEEPKVSTRKLGIRMDENHMTVWRVASEQLLHPYHLIKVQELKQEDFEPRQRFCEWLRGENTRNLNFIRYILATDEAKFTRNGVTNLHNEHVWAEENPKAPKITHCQQNFSVNVWCGIIDNYVIGPYFLPNPLNGVSYLHFLEHDLPVLLEDVPLQIRRHMWFLHDGAPPHFHRRVRQFISENFHNRWIGRGLEAPVKWPSRSPDLNPIDFCVWGFMKETVYAVEIQTEEQLRQRIITAADRFRHLPGIFQKVRFNWIKRCAKCVQNNGGHFEHQLA